jgi:TM2 domain-containing membrane protein YozV
LRGQILTYDQLRGEGLISGENGERYSFAGIEWKSPVHHLRAGAPVDFSPTGESASAIYVVPSRGTAAGGYAADEKSPIVAGLLAFFLGGFGVHKFYLGYNQEGVILLVGTMLSWALLVVLVGLFGLMAICTICFVEAIIYLTKSPAEFREIYVDGRKPWF